MSIKKITLFFLFLINCGLAYSQVSTADKSWTYFFKKGKLQYEREMYDYSLASMMRALDKNAELYEAANFIARVYVKKNKYEQALTYYLQSLKIKEDQPETHYHTGLVYEYFVDRDKAFKHFKRSIELNPLYALAHAQLVRHYSVINNFLLAEEHFNKSKSIFKEKAKKKLKKAKYLQKSSPKETIVLLEEVIKENPTIDEAYFLLVELYRMEKNFKKAAEVLEKLKYIKPYDKKVYVYLSQIYFTRPLPGKRIVYLNKALGNLKKAHKLYPRDPSLCYEISNIYQYMNKDLKAKKWYGKAKVLEKKSKIK